MKTTAYIQVAPKFHRHKGITGLRVVRASNKQPNEPVVGSVTLKLTIDIPEEVFKPIPVNISIPLESVQTEAKVDVEIPKR